MWTKQYMDRKQWWFTIDRRLGKRIQEKNTLNIIKNRRMTVEKEEEIEANNDNRVTLKSDVKEWR